MKKTIGSVCLILLSQMIFAQGNSNVNAYAEDLIYDASNKLSYVRLKQDRRISEQEVAGFINSVILNNGANKVAVLKMEKDELGFTHTKYNILQNGNLLANKVIIAHVLNGRLVSLNGDLTDVAVAGNSFSISESKALGFALAKVNAKKYKWENKEEELQMREALNDPAFTYSPKGIKAVLEKGGKFYNTYQFNIYAEEPLYRANVFVDASTGKVLDEQSLICHTDVAATANTKYSGTQTMTVDYTGSLYRLRETSRGQGIETYNMKNTSTYVMNATADFTNATTSWTSTGADQGATDAHWGAEKTYDYYFTQHNRNSINNAGFKLISFVHYQNNYQNAFWDGSRMTYGDGSGSWKIFTALDVCGHEITHGLTSNTGNLAYSNESGALNESFSDIFGTCIENYAKPTLWNWKIGEDIINNGMRSMSNPGSFGDPDTYNGSNYYTGTQDNGGVHTNSGVSNFWFYLLTMGGSGTNDLNNAYSVTGIGITNSAKIAFRALTVYFTPTTNFALARQYSIQAAKDLFGICSNEVIQTTRAWYAVGVGANYVNGFVGPNFTANTMNFCSVPATVNFNNTTVAGISYVWDFGDGTSASTTTANPSHTYSTVGTYAVKLKATGCTTVDSITKTAYITIYPPISSPVVSGITACENAPIQLGSGGSAMNWYNSPSGGILLGSGNPFITSVNTTTTFYAANTMTVAPVSGGMASNTGGGFSNNNTNYLIFDVMQNSTLNSVIVYAQTVGTPHIIELRNASNTVLNSTTVNLSVGANTVVLNYYMVPGLNYRLGLNSTSPAGLFRSNTGVLFPYNIGGVVNIKSSSAGNGSYYFFYNWQVTPEGCSSTRVPVVINVNPAPTVNINAPTIPVCAGDGVTIIGTPAGGTYAGNTMNGAVFTANAGPGTYTVSYTYTDANSCSSTMEASLIVQECTGIQANSANSSVAMYPNPAKDYLMISSGPAKTKVMIADASGRIVLAKDLNASEETLQLNALSSGMYLISVQDETGRTIKTSKLIKE